MNDKEREQWLADNYEKEQRLMIDAFVHWSIGRGIDPLELYRRAYPEDGGSAALHEAIAAAADNNDIMDIPDDALLHLLSSFDNEELAYYVSLEIDKLKRR